MALIWSASAVTWFRMASRLLASAAPRWPNANQAVVAATRATAASTAHGRPAHLAGPDLLAARLLQKGSRDRAQAGAVQSLPGPSGRRVQPPAPQQRRVIVPRPFPQTCSVFQLLAKQVVSAIAADPLVQPGPGPEQSLVARLDGLLVAGQQAGPDERRERLLSRSRFAAVLEQFVLTDRAARVLGSVTELDQAEK